MTVLLCGAMCVFSSSAQADPPVGLSIAEPVRSVALAPGGEVIVRGVVRSSYDGAAFDALTCTTGEGSAASTLPGGLYDLESGGFRLVSRDLRAHTYRLAATGREGAACLDAGLRSPCLVLRVLPLAQTRLMASAEFARTLSGAMEMEVLDAPTPHPTSEGVQDTRPLRAAGFLALAALLGWALRRRARRPEVRISRAIDRVCASLRAGDPVHQALVPSMEALKARASRLAQARASGELHALEAQVLAIEKRVQHERSRRVAEGAEQAVRDIEQELQRANESAAEVDAVLRA